MSNKEPKMPSRGVLDHATERAEFDAMMSGEPALTPEDIAHQEIRSREISKENNRRGNLRFRVAKGIAKIASGGSARY
jgi:hypothetical protein